MKISCLRLVGLAGLVMMGCGGSSGEPDGGASGSAGSAAAGKGGRGGTGVGGGTAGTIGTGGSSGAIGTGGGGGSTGVGGSGVGGSGVGGSGVGGSGVGGSGGSGVSCLNVQPCGGNVVGIWRYGADCLAPASLQSAAQLLFCSQASATSASATRSGTLNFGADGSYSVSETTTAIISYSSPFSCVSSSAASCAAYGSLVQQGASSGVTFTCTGSTICSCVEGFMSNSTDSGTYQTSGTSVVVTSAVDGSTTPILYCVQGSTLHLLTTDVNAANGIGEDVVLQRL